LLKSTGKNKHPLHGISVYYSSKSLKLHFSSLWQFGTVKNTEIYMCLTQVQKIFLDEIPEENKESYILDAILCTGVLYSNDVFF